MGVASGIFGWHKLNIEVGTATLTTGSCATISFAQYHMRTPIVALTVLSGSNDDGGDFNIFATNVTKTGFDISGSWQTGGQVNWSALSLIN